MKRVTTSLCMAAVMAWGATLVAQGNQTTQPREGSQTTATTQTQTRDTTMTQTRGNTTDVSYIGCVESSGPNAFALTVSELPRTTAAAGGTATATGTTGTTTGTRTGTATATGTMTSSATVGQRVQLIGSGRANIGSHVGHKVEVTGTMVPQGTAQGRTTGQPAAEMRLNVSNVRMISAMCDTANNTNNTANPNSNTSSPRTQPQGNTPNTTTQPQRQP